MTSEKTMENFTTQVSKLAEQKHKMEWYYFLIYCGMFVFALLHVLQGAVCLAVSTSTIYDPQAKITLVYIIQAMMAPANDVAVGNFFTTAFNFVAMIVKQWGEPNVRLAVVYLLVSVVMGLLYIFNWSLLRKRKRIGPTMFLFLLTFSTGLLPYFFQMVRLDTIGTITYKYMLDFVVMGVLIVLNKKYFDKRRDVFTEDGLF